MSESCVGYESSGDDFQCQAQDYLCGQPHHDLAHGPWSSWDMYACIESSFLSCTCLIPSCHH